MFLIAVVLGGCASSKEMNKNEIMEASPSKLPNAEAFQDEYTRQFMYSTEEVKEGYYLFESLTEKYMMDFPEDGIVMDHIKTEDNTSETITFLFTFNDESLSQLNYEFIFFLKRLEDGEEALQKIQIYPDTDFDYNSEMEKIETKDTMIYHALLERDLNGDVGHHMIGAIEAKGIPQMIYFDAKLRIVSEDERMSDETLEKAREDILELVERVQFTKEKE